MGVRGGEEKGKRELGSRESVGFVLEFLQGVALERGVQHVLPLGLKNLFRVFGQSGMAGCFAAQATCSFCGTGTPLSPHSWLSIDTAKLV